LNRNSKTDQTYKVVYNNPASRFKKTLLFSLLICLSGVGGYYTNGFFSHNGLKVLREELSKSSTLIKQHEENIAILRQQLIVVDRASQLSNETTGQINKEVKRLKKETVKLNQDIAFYKSVVSPTKTNAGVDIQKFELTPTSDPHNFQWKVVLMQSTKLHQFVKGSVRITLNGRQNDKNVSFDLHELSQELNGEEDIKLGFKYFQTIPKEGIKGYLQLPRGFTPDYLKLNGSTTSPKKSDIDRKIDWVIDEA